MQKRAKRYENSVGKFRRWSSDGGKALVEIVSKCDNSKRYLVVQKLGNGNEVIISRHRSKKAAERGLTSQRK